MDALVQTVQGLGLRIVEPKDFGPGPILKVHQRDYVEFLASAHRSWHEAGLVGCAIPNVFPTSRSGPPLSQSIIGRIGHYITDQITPIDEHTWQAAYTAAQVAVTAAQHILDGHSSSYGLCRPSGHHAARDFGGGATYLNNAAIAAQFLRSKFNRVAILDVDVHHGNGTQDIFYDRADVLFVSVHRHPQDYYPHFSGYPAETGVGAGVGTNFNLPVPAGGADYQYLAAVGTACEHITAFGAEVLVLSLGLDAHADDPAHGLQVTDVGFRAAGEIIGRCNRPTVLIQEGGYNLQRLGATARAFLSGFKHAQFAV
jgi:acetoin utilization deacetylase AcuC-like enzyme